MIAESPDGGADLSRLERHLRHQVGQAIADYAMIEDGDRIMVCLSGGKDSWTLLDILHGLQRSAPVRFELIAVHLDQKQPGYDPAILPAHLQALGIPFRIIEQDTYSVVQRLVPEGRTTCSLCSRLRRGALYEFAAANNCSRIALGHHREDIVETLFLNLFHQGRLKAMPPKLRSDDGRNTVIRPMAYIWEKDLAEFAATQNFPIIPCDLCGSQENLKRKRMKRLIDELQQEIPKVRKSMLTALGNVVNTHLMDSNLFDFKSIASGIGGGVGDISAELDAAVGVHDEAGEPLAMPALVSLTR